MSPLDSITVRGKLTLVIVLTSGVALLVACGGAVSYEWFHYRRDLVRELDAQSEIIAANSAAALALDDTETVQQNLSALQARPEIMQVVLANARGQVLAEYSRNRSGPSLTVLPPQARGHQFKEDCLLLVRPVRLGEGVEGIVYWKASLHDQNVRLRNYAWVVSFVIPAILILVLFLAKRLQRFVGVAEDITERHRLEKQVLEISDRERQRIGRDLHDGLCQHLVATAYAADMLGDKLDESAAGEATEAHAIAGLINQAITQARTVAQGLDSLSVKADGLVSALQELTFHTQRLWNISCRFEGDQNFSVETTAIATHLYRIAREAVANAVKHGKSKCIVVGLITRGDHMTLTVSDDGAGVPKDWERRKGMGLHIMSYRARMIGGVLEVQHGPGGGTVVTCQFPKTGIQTLISARSAPSA